MPFSSHLASQQTTSNSSRMKTLEDTQSILRDDITVTMPKVFIIMFQFFLFFFVIPFFCTIATEY